MNTNNHKNIVAFLFGVIGLSIRKIAEFTGISESTVNNDRRALGGAKAFPSRPAKENVFATALEYYLKLRNIARDEQEQSIFGALYLYLNLPVIETYAQGVSNTMTHLLRVTEPQQFLNYSYLLQSIFGYRGQVAIGLDDYWESIANALPKSRTQLMDGALHYIVEAGRPGILPALGDDIKESVDEALALLSEREQRVIRRRFGLNEDGKSQTLDEVAASFPATRQRIRQIEAKAMRKLRHPARSRRLKKFVTPYSETLCQLGNALYPSKLAETFSVAAEIDQALLEKSVDDLELSIRAFNCLKNADIQTVKKLVLKTKQEMLATKNFGRKALDEIEEILAVGGLSFGMVIEDGQLVPGPPDEDAFLDNFENDED